MQESVAGGPSRESAWVSCKGSRKVKDERFLTMAEEGGDVAVQNLGRPPHMWTVGISP